MLSTFLKSISARQERSLPLFHSSAGSATQRYSYQLVTSQRPAPQSRCLL